MGLTLYNIAAELLDLHTLRAEVEAEGDAEAVKVIDGQLQEWIQGCLATKADGIRGWLKHLAVQAAEWQEEADRFTALAKKAREDGDRLKTTVLYAMQLLEMKQVAGSKGDILLRRRGNGGVKPLVIAQPELVPEKYRRVTVTMPLLAWRNVVDRKELDVPGNYKEGTPEPDAVYIREALQRGEHVMGCRLDDRGEHLIVE